MVRVPPLTLLTEANSWVPAPDPCCTRMRISSPLDKKQSTTVMEVEPDDAVEDRSVQSSWTSVVPLETV